MQVKDSHKSRRSLIALALACAVLQLAVAPNIGLGDGRANLCLVAAACFALSTGGTPAVVFGFFSGLFYDLVTTGPVGLMSFELTLASLMLGMKGRNRLAEDKVGSAQITAATIVIVELVYGIAMVAVGGAGGFFQVLGLRTIPSVLLDMLAFVAVGFVIRRRAASGGGFGGGKPGKRGARFSTKGL